MKYYVEINGVKSTSIQGLEIQALPNISKPLMRSKREEIDGRDGDVITKLGYSAYDKTLKIGLWGNYDINQVIAFFNQEGVITFSNEPDKYYNFTILNREDYINKLEAFREASITIHCQPFKYELNEQPVELENEYVEETGTSLTFENSVVAPINIDLKGNTSQTGTPTPSTPIPVNVVSGDNDVKICGKNLFNMGTSSSTQLNVQMTFNGSEISFNGTANASAYLFQNISLGIFSAGTYVYSIAKKDGSTDSNNDALVIYNGSTNYVNRGTSSVPYNTTITLSEPTELFIKIWNNSGMKYNNYSIQIQIEKNNQATTYEAYNGTTYPINLPVQNLFDKDNVNITNFYSTATGFAQNNSANSIYIPIEEGKTYTISSTNRSLVDGSANITYTNKIIDNTSDTYLQRTMWNSSYSSLTTTAPSGATYIYVYVKWSTNQTDINNCLATIQIEEGSKANTYTPYGTTPIELCKIGTYQDYIYKENDKWYLHKEIGKVVLNGSEDEDWRFPGINNNYAQFNLANIDSWNNCNNGESGSLFKNKYFKYYAYAGSPSKNDSGIRIWGNGNPKLVFSVPTNILTTGSELSSFKTWLSNNANYFYYVLATPTNTEITYTPLINQLDEILEAQSRKGTTNITQVNNDLPFIITASVLCGGSSLIVQNKGNIYSKPTMTIYGSGTIGVYLSDTQIFTINLGDEEYITLDTENMEAYKVGVLKNRLVSGDYNSFKLETGNNTISFTGYVVKVEMQNVSRWI